MFLDRFNLFLFSFLLSQSLASEFSFLSSFFFWSLRGLTLIFLSFVFLSAGPLYYTCFLGLPLPSSLSGDEVETFHSFGPTPFGISIGFLSIFISILIFTSFIAMFSGSCISVYSAMCSIRYVIISYYFIFLIVFTVVSPYHNFY